MLGRWGELAPSRLTSTLLHSPALSEPPVIEKRFENAEISVPSINKQILEKRNFLQPRTTFQVNFFRSESPREESGAP